MHNKIKVIFFGLFLLFCLSACSISKKTPPTTPLAPPAMPIQAEPPPVDPYEHYNRNAYRFNDKIDKVILKPMAKGYQAVTPKFFRTGVTNFFNNLAEIPRLANDVLQAHGYWAIHDLGRLLINTTVGILGVFDVAEKLGLETHHNSFSFTLDRWGAVPSPYVVMPFFGPSMLNNFYGMPMDFYLSPWGIMLHSPVLGYSLFGLSAVNTRSNFLNNEDLMNQVAIDHYIFIRNAYLQLYQKQLTENEKLPGAKLENQEELYTGD